MAIVIVPVSTLSKKILMAEYGGAPVQPGRACWLSDLLRVDRSDTQFHQRMLDVLNDKLELIVTSALADRIIKHPEKTGAVLHRHHVEMITRHMLSASESGVAAKTAMQAFYESYDLDDDDLDQETIYREYSRFKQNKSKKIAAKSETKSKDRVLRQSRIWQGLEPEKDRLTNTQLDALCRLLDERLAAQRIRRVCRLSFQAYLYIYVVCGGRSAVQAGKKFKRYKANVYKALRTIRMKIRTDKKFAAAILPILDGSAVLPAPEPENHLCIDSPQLLQAHAISDRPDPKKQPEHCGGSLLNVCQPV